MNVSPFRDLSTEKVSFGFNIISLKPQGKCLRKTLIHPSFRYSTFIDFPQVVKLFSKLTSIDSKMILLLM